MDEKAAKLPWNVRTIVAMKIAVELGSEITVLMDLKVNRIMFISLDWADTKKYWSLILPDRILHNLWAWQLIYYNHYFCLFFKIWAHARRRERTSLISYNRRKPGYSSLFVQPCEWILKALQQALYRANLLKSKAILTYKLNIFQQPGVSIRIWRPGFAVFLPALLLFWPVTEFRLVAFRSQFYTEVERDSFLRKSFYIYIIFTTCIPLRTYFLRKAVSKHLEA